MKSIRLCAALMALLAFAVDADAQLRCRQARGSAGSKCCECAPSFQPSCCAPTIARPCHTNVYNYQRQFVGTTSNCGCGKKGNRDRCRAPRVSCGRLNRRGNGCCDTGVGSGCAAPCGNSCDPGCAAPCGRGSRLARKGCCSANSCAAPCNTGCAAPCGDSCCGSGRKASRARRVRPCRTPRRGRCGSRNVGCDNTCAPSCAAPRHRERDCRVRGTRRGCASNNCCAAPCGGADCCPTAARPVRTRLSRCARVTQRLTARIARVCGRGNKGAGCCDTGNCCPTVRTKSNGCDPCHIAQLIYESQTACYPRQRGNALRGLGRCSCECNPEIMTAFIYSLNDADPGVRHTAANEIEQQLRRHCCCSAELTSALTCALADCDKGVRREAERALSRCGYQIVDGCCNTCDGCVNGACNAGNAGNAACCPGGCAPVAPVQVPAQQAIAPEAPAAPAAYFPRQLPQQDARPISGSRSLSKLFSMAK